MVEAERDVNVEELLTVLAEAEVLCELFEVVAVAVFVFEAVADVVGDCEADALCDVEDVDVDENELSRDDKDELDESWSAQL